MVKYISIGMAISFALAVGATIMAQQKGNAEAQACAYSASAQSYEVVETHSLDDLRDHVRRGIDKAGWQPQGGIAYNVETKQYLQVMVHPRKMPSYP